MAYFAPTTGGDQSHRGTRGQVRNKPLIHEAQRARKDHGQGEYSRKGHYPFLPKLHKSRSKSTPTPALAEQESQAREPSGAPGNSPFPFLPLSLPTLIKRWTGFKIGYSLHRKPATILRASSRLIHFIQHNDDR